VLRFLNDEIDAPPPYPENYFTAKSITIAEAYLGQALDAKARGNPIPAFPAAAVVDHVDNTGGDTGKAIVNNWLGLVYQLTSLDRRVPFKPGINPDDPLGLT
jgi:homoserine O-succinyltransferase